MHDPKSDPTRVSAYRRAFGGPISGARWCRFSVLAAMAIGSAVLVPEPGRADSPITVTDSWFRYILPQVPAGGYMTLQNSSSRAVVLTGASSAACGMLMLHRSEQRGGVEKMIGLRQVTVPAQGAVRFSPGGYHLMCMQPKMQPGETVGVTLSFQGGDTVSAGFPVYAVGHGPQVR